MNKQLILKHINKQSIGLPILMLGGLFIGVSLIYITIVFIPIFGLVTIPLSILFLFASYHYTLTLVDNLKLRRKILSNDLTTDNGLNVSYFSIGNDKIKVKVLLSKNLQPTLFPLVLFIYFNGKEIVRKEIGHRVGPHSWRLEIFEKENKFTLPNGKSIEVNVDWLRSFLKRYRNYDEIRANISHQRRHISTIKVWSVMENETKQ